MASHHGKTAVVTGGAKGIGRGIVERLVRDGARVVIADIDIDAAKDLAAEIGSAATAVRVDVRDEAQLRSAVETGLDRFGTLDIMINNAGILEVMPITQTNAQSWERILGINVVGVALGTKVAAEHMMTVGGGSIVNASSGGGRHGAPNLSQYCASKAAIIMLSQAAAIELAPHHIRVNCYTPGHIMTPLWDGILSGLIRQSGKTEKELLDGFLETIPAGRFGTPEDVAAAVAWLTTDDASYVSGQCIAMNGAELPW